MIQLLGHVGSTLGRGFAEVAPPAGRELSITSRPPETSRHLDAVDNAPLGGSNDAAFTVATFPRRTEYPTVAR